MRAPSAGTAKRSSAPRTSRPRSSARRPRASPRSSSCESIPTPLHRPPRCPRSAKKHSSQSDEVRIGLVRALEAQEVVIAAVLAVRVRAAYAWGCLVHRAAARLLVEEHADGLEHGVLPVP